MGLRVSFRVRVWVRVRFRLPGQVSSIKIVKVRGRM